MGQEVTVLVVDDERVIRDGCARLLGSEQIRVITADNGEQALQVLTSESVHTILCDLKMPVMGAVEVLKVTSTAYPNIPVVIITGHGTVENAVECMKMGAYDFVTKPFRGDHLVMVTKRALEKHRLEIQMQQLERERAQNLYDLAAEQSRIRAVVNCMAEGVLVTNRALEIVLYNPALMRFLELARPIKHAEGLTDTLGNHSLLNALRSLIADPTAHRNEYISQEFTQGTTHLRTLSTLVEGPEAEVLGTVTVFQDITSFVELNEMKSNFVHMVSHELRSPLAAIQQQHTVLLKGLAGDLSDKQREILDRGQKKIQGLLSLINELLDVAKIESGRSFQKLVPVQLADVLRETLQLLEASAAAQKVQLCQDLPPSLPLIAADPRSMEEVFVNLVSNAINYSPDGGRVLVRATNRNGNRLEVSVQDTGVGIEPEEIPKIFDKFYRVKHPRTRHVIGTGLGLALVKGIVDAHHGSIQVESRPGVGTTFRIHLPVMAEGTLESDE